MKKPATLKTARQEFLGRWIAYGAGLFSRAEAHGIDWRSMPLEQLSAAIYLAEEWSAPEEYKEDANTQTRLIANT